VWRMEDVLDIYAAAPPPLGLASAACRLPPEDQREVLDFARFRY
jgi:hypothetical protein